ncbi:MAG: arsenate reductase ArsC [Bdellovibrionales bacterium]|nr:arsenate reductase ArsC [Bdellovibrionales bacterium]
MKILFMCVANSARSQLAESLAKQIFGSSAEINSAGSNPSKVNSLAIEVMKELSYDLTTHRSKTINDLPPWFLVDLNYVITLCAEEVCPFLPSKTATKLHWPMPDPVGRVGLSRDEQLKAFRDTREALKAKILDLKSELKI